MMLEGAGFEVFDLGINNSVESYLDAIEKHKPDILGMSALLTTTMPNQQKTIEALKAASEEPWVEIILARFNPYATLMDVKKPDEVRQVIAGEHLGHVAGRLEPDLRRIQEEQALVPVVVVLAVGLEAVGRSRDGNAAVALDGVDRHRVRQRPALGGMTPTP